MEFLIGFIILACVFCLISICYAITHFHKVYYRLSSDKISKPVKFVLLSDLHDKSFGKENEKLIKAIESEQPDAILMAGDMLTASLDRAPQVAEKLCAKLAQKYSVFYGIGNHEAKQKWSKPYYKDAYEVLLQKLTEMGVTVLEDAHITYGQTSICIYGLDLEKKYYKRGKTVSMDADYMTQKLGEANKEQYNILLAHNPEYFDAYASWEADLVLSGHLHGGLIRLPWLGGLIAPSLRFFPKYDGGLFKKNGTDFIVSRGLGFHNLGLRMWNQGELVVIEILPTNE